MSTPIRRLMRAQALVAALLALGACASAERDRSTEIEPLLLEAGFQKRVADTPEKLAHLRTMPALTLTTHVRRGTYYYILPDPQGCRCMYVGTEAAYEQYQALVLRQTMNQDKISATRADEESMLNWGLWGPSVWP
jgi:hypothetical protein